ncbi:MAG TPA: hypothetical protein VFC82_02695 [Actinomycetaceae bacterium]|nr:hypothetical protein [Actinomycetaceae bacterium]
MIRQRSSARGAGAVLVTLSTFGSAIAHWFVVLIMARVAGAEQVGLYSSLLAVATPVYVGGSLALRDVYLTITRNVAWRHYVVLRVLGMLASTAVMLLAALLLDWWMSLVLALVAMKVTAGAVDLAQARILGANRLLALGSLGLGTSIGTVVLLAVVALEVPDVSWLVASVALVSAAFLVPYGIAAARAPALESSGETLRGSGGETPHDGARPCTAPYVVLLEACLPAMLAQLLSTLLLNAPIIIVSVLSTPSDVGRYSVAAYVVTFGHLFGSAMMTVHLPALRRLRTSFGTVRMLAEAKRVSAVILALGLGATLLVVAFGDAVIGFLFGREFAIGRPVWLVLGLCATVAAVGYIANAASLSLNQYAAQPWIMALAILASAAIAILLAATPIHSVVIASIAALCGTSVRTFGLWHLAGRSPSLSPQRPARLRPEESHSDRTPPYL